MKKSNYFILLPLLFFMGLSSLFFYTKESNKILVEKSISFMLLNEYKSINDFEGAIFELLKESNIDSFSIYDEKENIFFHVDNNPSYLFSVSERKNFHSYIKIKSDKLLINGYQISFNDDIYITISAIFILSFFTFFIIFNKKIKNYEKKFISPLLNIRNINQLLSLNNKNKIINTVKDRFIEIYFENEKNLLWEISERDIELDSLKKQNFMLIKKNKIERKHEKVYRKELGNIIKSLEMLSLNFSEKISNEKDKRILSAVKRQINDIGSIVEIDKILRTNEKVHKTSRLNMMDEINQIIFDTHDYASRKKIKVDYYINNSICREIHGYGEIISFIFGFLLKEIINISSKNSEIRIRTIYDEDKTESYISFEINVIGNRSEIRESENLELVNYVSEKFNDSFSLSTIKNRYDNSFSSEIKYKTKCLMSLFEKKEKRLFSNFKIGVYSKNISTYSRISSQLIYSGIILSEISGIKDIENFDLIFIESFSLDKKEHQFIKNLGVKICSIEREVDPVILKAKKFNCDIFDAISYASRTNDYIEIIKSLDDRKKKTLPSKVQELLSSSISSSKKEGVFVNVSDKHLKYTIETILKSTSIYDVVDDELISQNDSLEGIYEVLHEKEVTSILMDEIGYLGLIKKYGKEVSDNIKSSFFIIGIDSSININYYDYKVSSKNKYMIDEIIFAIESKNAIVISEPNVLNINFNGKKN